MAGQRILVTGASGFIGASLVVDLARQGHEIVSLGRHAPVVADGVTNVKHVATSLSEAGSLPASLRSLQSEPRFDTIIHLAVSRHHREFPQKALDLFYVNTASVAELLDFARLTGVKRAVFGSTGTVYSSQSLSDGHEEPGNRESEFRCPTSYFAASKLFSDTFCQFYRSYFPISVLRLYAPYGPGLTERMLTDMVGRVQHGRPLSLPLEGPGLAFAATYIDDAKAVIQEAMHKEWNEVVNVAAPEVWTVDSVGHLIGELVGRTPIYERGGATFGPRIVPDTSRLAQLMPDHAFTGLRSGLRAMIEAVQH